MDNGIQWTAFDTKALYDQSTSLTNKLLLRILYSNLQIQAQLIKLNEDNLSG